MSDDWVQRALQLLQEARRMDLVRGEALKMLHPARKALDGVAAALWACSPSLRVRSAEAQVRVVRAVGTFCRRLGLALVGQSLPLHHVRLKAGVRGDLRMWRKFLEFFNGIPLQAWKDCEWDAQIIF
ncbi:hypothetical protein NDU88_000301 [Pleurodeles waltl]|uniref:Uncharacterized protein n=1 Tax=Pleurodeles waltl TaxID=8319 RepID=A0AAV7UPK8_PLEWA|nr:hypothetical protein NDU88_000301 [Pleurodeles waltl]